MTTIKIVPDFPGAYGAKVDAWERQKRKEIALMPKREGYRPGMVLKPRPTATITRPVDRNGSTCFLRVPYCARGL